jgi:hypothetical protein
MSRRKKIRKAQGYLPGRNKEAGAKTMSTGKSAMSFILQQSRSRCFRPIALQFSLPRFSLLNSEFST